MTAADGRFTVLCVCTGNICRSPAAEILLRRVLDRSVRVASAGTSGMPAWPMSPPMAALLPDADADDVAAFRSAFLDERLLRQADLVLAMAGEHRSQVVALDPLALRRTFTLGELARLSGDPGVRAALAGDFPDDAARLGALIPAAHAARRHRRAVSAEDVPDPYGRGDAAYAGALTTLQGHLETVVSALEAGAR